MGSDFHFGIPGVDQEEMAAAFAKTIFPLLKDTDILFINGDFFDGPVSFDNPMFDPIYDVIISLLTLCETYGIKLRILQGTWMHDRAQLKRITGFYTHGGFTFDYKLIETVELEEIVFSHRSLKVLYLPDDLPFKSSQDILDVVLDKKAALGWDQIDYVCLHGFMDFTFPKVLSRDNAVVYSEDQFPFVKKLIDAGHVHEHRIVGNAISNGSFDRLVAGDENPKGCIQIDDYPDHYTARFVENTYSAIYDTLIFGDDMSTQDICHQISTHIASLNTERMISLRFIIERSDLKDAIKAWMRETYPKIRLNIKKQSETSDKPVMVPQSALFVTFEREIAPTPKTLPTFIRNHIPEDVVLSVDRIETHLSS